MVTSLIVGTAVPSGDAAFVRALNDAIAGFWNEPPAWHHEVINDEGAAYRRLVIDGLPAFQDFRWPPRSRVPRDQHDARIADPTRTAGVLPLKHHHSRQRA